MQGNTIACGENPFPAGKRWLIILKGSAAAFQLTGHFYAVRYLPMSDVMMIASIKPVFTSLMAWIFLKEACGQCGIKCLVGCDHKNKTKMVYENLMHDGGYQGDIMHKILGLLFSNALKNGIVSEKTCNFYYILGRGCPTSKSNYD